ncbi:10489_t:CDS:2 [Acaulospora morrowiae]|uniref:10489_t:CDS:1 n=1 Tax=Acaulospora morrowiae TaxID=94023 RepID=A0A9N8WAS2_9GLOM|nr:10489_t:CDS:2 [Acaulospora morrowiae]
MEGSRSISPSVLDPVTIVDSALQYGEVSHVCVNMDVDYSLGYGRFCVKYCQDFPAATEKELEDAYNKYKVFYTKHHRDNPGIATDCCEEFLQTLGKRERGSWVLLVGAELRRRDIRGFVAELGYMEAVPQRIVRMHYDMRWGWDIEQSRSKAINRRQTSRYFTATKCFPELFQHDVSVFVMLACLQSTLFCTGGEKTALPYTTRLEGLGGTNLKTFLSEGGGVDAYEGIDVNNPDICPREETLRKLVETLHNKRVLLVRSPPMAGKTSLAQLLERYLLRDNTIRVFRISLLWLRKVGREAWMFEERFKELMNGTTWSQFVDECRFIQTFLIVDEVQVLYSEKLGKPSHNGGDVFWNVFKDCMQYANLRICAFAVYGYRGAWDGSASSGTMNVSPIKINSRNTWSLEEMCFTDEEYHDYVSRFCNKYLNMNDDDALCLQQYVYNTTERHPGLVAFFMNNIKNHFSQQLKYPRERETLTWDKVFKYLKSYNFWDTVVDGVRAYTKLEHLSDDEILLCDDVFRYSVPIRDVTESKSKRLIKTNMLVEKNERLEFAAPYLCILYMQERWGSTNRATKAPEDLKSFLIDTFTVMDPQTLQNSFGVGKDKRLLERTWQMEFYRAATQVLSNTVYISPDVGADFGSRGFVDFYVDDDRNWVIELLRDGERAKEHEKRFESDGIYAKILESSKESVIIDIRNPDLCNSSPAKCGCNWMNVYCQKGWESVIIEYKGMKQEIRLIGEQGVMLEDDERSKN